MLEGIKNVSKSVTNKNDISNKNKGKVFLGCVKCVCFLDDKDIELKWMRLKSLGLVLE